MGKSPGHEKWPEHEVREEYIGETVEVEINGELVAESNDVVRVDEDDMPPRYYFPRGDVSLGKLERSNTTTECPFKGTAHYFNIRAGGRIFKDAVWTYEDPYDEHGNLKDRLAFYDSKIRAIKIRAA